MRKKGLIIVGDLHLRDTAPVCRTDYWWGTMERKLEFIADVVDKERLPVAFVGDLFDETYKNPLKPSYKLLKLFYDNTIYYESDDYFTIIGNHDIPSHNMERFDETGLYFLHQMRDPFVLFDPHAISHGNNDYTVLSPFHWNDKLVPLCEYRGTVLSKSTNRTDVAVVHKLCWHREKPFPDAPDDGDAIEIMKKLKGFELIVIGDSHQKFVVEGDGQLLINPGSVLRLTAAQKDHKPAIFIWRGGKEYEEISIPIDETAVSSAHLDAKKETMERVAKFVSDLRRSDDQCDLDFLGQLRRTLDHDPSITDGVRHVVHNSIEEASR